MSRARQARWNSRSPRKPQQAPAPESECCIFLQIFHEETEDWIVLFKMHFAFFVCFVEMFLKKRFYVIKRRSVVNCTAVVIMTYFYIK